MGWLRMGLKEKLLNTEAQGPLKDILVLDFTRWVSGPYCTNMLSDMGATVIKVESLRGDQARGQIGGNEAAFRTYNHGKKSLAVNLQIAEGKDIVYRLAAEADVAVENYRPGVADELGIGYQKLSSLNPGIVYCSITAFGTSPAEYAHRAGVDPIIQGMGGVMSVTGEPGGPPMRVGVPIADMNGACYGYAALVTALYHRSVTGLGQHVSVAIIDTMVFILSTRFAELVGLGRIPQPMGNAHSHIVPFQAFQTSDGWITVATVTEEQWQQLCVVLGAEHLAEDHRYASAKLRLENRDSLAAELDDYFQARSSKEWLDVLMPAGVMCGPIWNVKELVESDLASDHGFIPKVSHPVEGEYPVLQTPFNFSKTPGKVQGPAPLLGEHTYEILSTMGFSDDEIRGLQERKVVRMAGNRS